MRLLAAAPGGISSRTLRALVWRGMVEANSADRTLAEHEAIFQALAAGDACLAQAAALLHVSTTEQWLREHLEPNSAVPDRP